jgi:hypothetical protein
MKKASLCCILSLFLVSVFFGLSSAAKPAKVEVLFMNHGPLMETIDKIKSVFSGFGDKISVSWYDFETKEGEKFMAQKGVRQHIPLVIWINDSPVVNTGAKEVQFAGFPTGSGPSFFQGKWTMEDLKNALHETTKSK